MSRRPLNRRRLLAASGITAAVTATANVQRSGIAAQEASPMASPVASPGATPVVSEDLPLEQIALLTGSDPLSINDTDEEYGVHGTDLGSSFLYNDQLYIVFGDTFGPGGLGGSDWRSKEIHFMMSLFGPYNVYQMMTSLPDLAP